MCCWKRRRAPLPDTPGPPPHSEMVRDDGGTDCIAPPHQRILADVQRGRGTEMNPALGIGLKLGAVVAFVTMQVLIKSTGGRVPPGEVVFFRSLFAFPVILAWLAWTRELHVGWRTDNPMSHVWRGVVGTSAMGLSFAALQLLPLPEVTALSYAAPILLVIFAAVFLGERVRLVRIFAVALGMTGVVIVLAPQLTAFTDGEVGTGRALGAVLILLAATLVALAQILVRKMVATERAATVVLYFTVSSTLFSLLTIPFGWVLPSGRGQQPLAEAAHETRPDQQGCILPGGQHPAKGDREQAEQGR